MLKTHARALFKTTRESCISLHGFTRKAEKEPQELWNWHFQQHDWWLRALPFHRGFASRQSSGQVKWKQSTSRRSLHLAKQEESIQVSSERVEVWKEQTAKKDVGCRICPDHVSPSLTSTTRYQVWCKPIERRTGWQETSGHLLIIEQQRKRFTVTVKNLIHYLEATNYAKHSE